MTTEYFKIAGGTVYDPANGVDGQVRDLCIAARKIVRARCSDNGLSWNRLAGSMSSPT